MHRTLCTVSLSLCGLVAGAASMLWVAPARADDVMTSTCFGTGRSFSCVDTWRSGETDPYVRHVSPPQSKEEIASAAERDRLWVARCRPIVMQDAFGVARYHYAATGCEYGKYE